MQYLALPRSGTRVRLSCVGYRTIVTVKVGMFSYRVPESDLYFLVQRLGWFEETATHRDPGRFRAVLRPEL
jgi:hypothetical protein